jgi:hypothetical protein
MSWIKEAYPPSKRKDFQNRFTEMAYVFYKLEEEEFAQISLGSGRLLEEEDQPFKENTLLMYFLDRSLQIYKELSAHQEKPVEANEKPGSSIITP